jgi:hypothetical protein
VAQIILSKPFLSITGIMVMVSPLTPIALFVCATAVPTIYFYQPFDFSWAFSFPIPRWRISGDPKKGAGENRCGN